MKRVMHRLLPHPLLSLGILLMWALLQSSLKPATLAMGALLGFLVPFVMTALQVEKPRMRSPLKLLRLFGVVLADMLRSNFAVAKVILSNQRCARVSGFVELQLRMHNRHGLAMLAIILSSIPGTLWVQYDAATGKLLMHVLDLVDEDDWSQIVRERYETPLMEIFE